ncbi:hemerythrin domain-containing protein [Tomitella gaofuii]|uniref:hemerythrin domain-containing protein n=1 Tax=Tomitella gaofuii TaxID=2760083 RepID=UPI0015F97627|nr:hemerythrin domain-containing protein [Tomitella gaofuii]
MTDTTLAEALEAEHHAIDDGIYAFLNGDADGRERLEAVFDELRRHIYLEEVYLFPPLRDAGMMAPVFVMLREHGEMWQILDQVDAALTVDPVPASSAAALCRDLLTRLDAHNSKEEPILYPELQGVLSDSAAEQYLAFLEGGESPDGWVCERAAAGPPASVPWG